MTDRPWMQALETQFTILDQERRFQAMGTPQSVATPMVREYLPEAVAFSWSRDAAAAVWLASQSLPLTARCGEEMFPDGLRCCWWWLHWPLPIVMAAQEGFADPYEFADEIDVSHVSGLLVVTAADGQLGICDVRKTAHGPMPTGLVGVSRAASLQEIIDGDGIDPRTMQLTGGHTVRSLALVRFVMAASVWLKQRLVSMSSGPVERHRRKHGAREYDMVVNDVKVIELRRLESESRPPNPDSEPVDWSCRWIVNGHWRNQPYADGKHELIYILPHVKGPGDKPLRVPTHTVYQVSR